MRLELRPLDQIVSDFEKHGAVFTEKAHRVLLEFTQEILPDLSEKNVVFRLNRFMLANKDSFDGYIPQLKNYCIIVCTLEKYTVILAQKEPALVQI